MAELVRNHGEVVGTDRLSQSPLPPGVDLHVELDSITRVAGTPEPDARPRERAPRERAPPNRVHAINGARAGPGVVLYCESGGDAPFGESGDDRHRGEDLLAQPLGPNLRAGTVRVQLEFVHAQAEDTIVETHDEIGADIDEERSARTRTRRDRRKGRESRKPSRHRRNRNE